MNRNVLILGSRAPMALELARSFHKYGSRVVFADSLKFPIGRWTNTIVKYERLPSARHQTLQYVDAISRLVAKYAITDIIPCCEEVFYIARYKDKWNCKVWTSDLTLLNTLHNKETFAQACKTHLNIPETISMDQFTDWSHSNEYVFKPKYSRFANQVFIGQFITHETVRFPENWIAQKKITGKEICVYSIWDKGKLKGYACYEPLYRAGKGAGIFFKRTENEQVKNQVKSLGKAHNYTGQLSFDVILSNDNKEAWFIECNPRGTSGAHLLNSQLAACFFKEAENVSTDSKDYMLSSLMLFTHPVQFFRKKMKRAKGVIFKTNDPLPSLLQLLSVVELVYLKFSKKVSLLEATTYDIEWNGNES